MRDYGKVLPAFWTRGSGKALRGDAAAQVVALYLFTCPSATMTGLFYLPLPTLAHETGIPLEGVRKALGRVSEAGIASYDEAAELVWVPEMARIQIGETLVAKDNRIKAVERELATYAKHAFYNAFLARYSDAYRLSSKPNENPLPTPFRPPSDPLGSQEQDQEQEQEHSVCVSPDPRANASQDPGQDIHAQSAESYEMPTLPDAEWLASELAKRPALARFADDPDLCADLAGGLQDRSRTHAQAAQVIAAFVAKEGKVARDMSAAEFQKAFGGYVVNARLHAGAPSSEPQHPDVREALTIFAERWKHARGAARVEDADDAEHAVACIEMAKKAIVASKSEARPREVYRRAVDAYLADSATWLADAQWPLRMLAKKFSSYASIPPVKARPGPAKAPEEPTMPMRRRATYAEAAAMAQGTGTRSGNMGPALALVFDRDKVSSG